MTQLKGGLNHFIVITTCFKTCGTNFCVLSKRVKDSFRGEGGVGVGWGGGLGLGASKL